MFGCFDNRTTFWDSGNGGRKKMPRALILVLITVLLLPLAACNLQIGNDDISETGQLDIESAEGAREGINLLNIPYTVDDFVKCAKESDAVAVNLFLIAGMNPNAKDSNGITALKAATEAGHTEVIELLKEAGAKQ
jgi:ankyrin repeat protein